MSDERLEILFSASAVGARVAELGAAISRDYLDHELALVCLLKGAVFFCADLARAIDLPLQVEFVRAASYGRGKASSGAVRIEEVNGVLLEGRDILVVEDIVDSGRTLARVLDHVRERGARSVEVCALLYKELGLEHPFSVRYVGFWIPDRFVVGYGLDHSERYRNLPYIAALRD